MTSAVQDHPHTALDLLFGPGNETPEAMARQLLSAGADGDLGRALENLPRATRDAAVRETTAAAAGLLNVDLFGGLVAGWRKHHDLTAAAQRTLAVPGSVELVDMAGHQITTSQPFPASTDPSAVPQLPPPMTAARMALTSASSLARSAAAGRARQTCSVGGRC